MRFAAVILLFASMLACVPSADSRFATPKDTIETLFTAYGVRDVGEAEIIRRMQAQERFKLLDPAMHRACFADWKSDSDQGIAGFVFGRLVAAKDHLKTKIEGDTATVRASESNGPNDPVVLKRGKSGWKIVLQQSAPETIKRQLYEVYRRAKATETRAGSQNPGLKKPLP